MTEIYEEKKSGSKNPYQQNDHVRDILGMNTLGSKEGAASVERQIEFLRRHKQLGSCFHKLPDEPVKPRRNPSEST